MPGHLSHLLTPVNRLDRDQHMKDNPPRPYRPGYKFSARPHKPPAAFWHRDSPRTGPYADEIWLQSVTRMEAVLRNPPLEAKGTSHRVLRSHRTITLKITKILGGKKDYDDVYVAVCTVSGHSTRYLNLPSTVVAKIYDLVYYSLRRKNAYLNAAHKADGDYSREAAVHERLSSTKTTSSSSSTSPSFTPTYYGAWTFDVAVSYPAVPKVESRAVRLLLMEYISGPSLDRVWRKYLWQLFIPSAEEYRMTIWAAVLDAQARLAACGVKHRDEALRNIVICPGPAETSDGSLDIVKQKLLPPPRVVEIDFEKSGLRPLPGGRDSRPENPIDREWVARAFTELGGWLPYWYHHDASRRRRWLVRQFGGEKREAYRPIKQDLGSLHLQ
ncbi:uncharacterized protein B0I36DRAFT_361459 [Microdochium trichocladiopsis]|uniref:Uncharacterized protein n=1 Tax=Microdochium trichocladiopsis TaxID=1682393 RepID=A0A9P9BRA3_9PEZI|nr:uncharacterized protein B0I36DRAFT_361459 [Microdochium trichocladiopsis]KAH7032681.1 hypothetical protein B0I36DRAFT_361459 [Microdochium trichocladiopsis]